MVQVLDCRMMVYLNSVNASMPKSNPEYVEGGEKSGDRKGGAGSGGAGKGGGGKKGMMKKETAVKPSVK